MHLIILLFFIVMSLGLLRPRPFDEIKPADVQPLLDEALAGHLSGEASPTAKTYMYGIGSRVQREPLANITARFVASLDDVVKSHLGLVKTITDAGGRVHSVTVDQVVFRRHAYQFVDMQIYALMNYDLPPEAAQVHIDLLN